MSNRFVRQSHFRHVRGDAAKPESQFIDLKPNTNGDGNYIAANTHFFAFAGTGGGGPCHVVPHEKVGRLNSAAPKLSVHKAAVTDFDFNPFNPFLLATASEDCHVKITQIPEGGLSDNVTDAAATLEGHQKKVTFIKFHPTAGNVLSSVSADNTIKIWDVEAQAQVGEFAEFGSAIHSQDWNANGSLLATTSQDKVVRVFDPRAPEGALKTGGLEGNKASKVVWSNSLNKLLVVGFSKTSCRQVALYDPKNMDKALTVTDLDQSAGVMIPYYDDDTNMLYVAGKGDSSIKYFEIVEEAPFIHFLDQFSDNQSQKGLCFLPKRAMDVGKCEIARAYRLMKESVIPISFIVPRKSELFQADLFPDCYAGVQACEAKEWLAGANAAAPKVSMKPGASKSASAAPVAAFKAKKSSAELESELAAAHARIAELEKEVARLRA